MRKPWSISTTVRNPERLRSFLIVLKKLEGEKFNEENQKRYQVLLIKDRLYTPNYIPENYKKYYKNMELDMPYEVAEDIFNYQEYKASPMRGRQSANPLNKLGFSIARERFGPIKITPLGNEFLKGNYDIGTVFFKSLLKMQFPNLWSRDFTEREGFNIIPFITTLHFIKKLNESNNLKGLNKNEFSIFIPTLINANQINEYIVNILKYRNINGKEEKENYIYDFAKKFYGDDTLPEKKINNLFDYGDNIMRYFRLTRYFKIIKDPLGYHWRIDLEPSRIEEIKQLLEIYDGSAIKFVNLQDYLNYISDIERPILPWEELKNLQKIAKSKIRVLIDFIEKEEIDLSLQNVQLLKENIEILSKEELNPYISKIQMLYLDNKNKLRRERLVGNLQKTREIRDILDNNRELRRLKPEQFEELITEALEIINDEILIQPNYPVDDEGKPISHSPAKKADIECYYETFNAVVEVTLNTSNLQWVQEGQPVMRHLRNFENKYGHDNIFCIFIAPRIHDDTYSMFLFSVKQGYDGIPQSIIPLTASQFSLIMTKLILKIINGVKFSHKELQRLYKMIIDETREIRRFSEWGLLVEKTIQEWKDEVVE